MIGNGIKIAVIVAVNEYNPALKPQIESVDYAIEDAEAFQKCLIDYHDVEPGNITIWRNHLAGITTLQNELSYIIRNLGPLDTFYFYYAGHGFFANGHNKLTLYDSHSNNLQETTLSFQDVLLNPLIKSGCKKAFLFIDACAVPIDKDILGRSVINRMDDKEFKTFIDQSEGYACFFSCSPGQKSFSSNKLKHGIWTWHLLEALNGDAEDAFERHGVVTTDSLKSYLSRNVPIYITKETKIRLAQTPYSLIATTTQLSIVEFEYEVENEVSDVRLKFQDYDLKFSEEIPYRDFPGFKKGLNTVPDRASSSAEVWAQKLTQDIISEEIEAIYNETKELLGFKKNQCEKDPETGYLATPYFRYDVQATQSKTSYGKVFLERKLEIRVALSELPDGFEDCFPKKFNQLHIPVVGEIDFESLIDQLEDVDRSKGRLVDKENEIIFYPALEGVREILIDETEIVIYFTPRVSLISDILILTQSALGLIAGPISNLLESKD